MTSAQPQSRNGRNLCSLFFTILLAGIISFAGSQNSNCDPNVLVVDLNDADLNAIKARLKLGTLKTNTFISVAGSTVVDAKSLPVNQIDAANAISADSVLTDNVSPTLHEWLLNMDENKLYLTFTETVKANSFTPGTLKILKGSATSSAGVTIDATADKGTQSTEDSTVITFVLSKTDANAIKAIADLGTTAGDVGDTFLHFATSTVQDMATNALGNNNPMSAATVTDDASAPLLERFELDIDEGAMKLVFDETVKADTIDVSKLALCSNAACSGANDPQLLTGTTRKAGSDTISTDILLELTTDILNKLKINTELAIGPGNDGKSFLILNSNAVTDMAEVGQVNALTKRAADAYQADSTDPTLLSFSMNMNDGTITMIFDEAIDASSMKSNYVKILAAKGSSISHTLSALCTTSSVDGTTYVMQLTDDDFDALAKNEGVATKNPLAAGSVNTFLSFQTGGVVDMVGRTSGEVSDANALQATAYVEDSTAPTLDTYTLDMNAGTLVLTFSETMNANAASIVAANNIQIQSTRDANAIGAIVVVLTGSTDVTQDDGTEVTIKLLTTDLNKLKLDDGIATTNSNIDTYLSFSNGLIQDQAGVSVTARGSDDALARSAYTPDGTKPKLESTTYNVNSGVLTLTFDEPIRYSEVTEASITLTESLTNPAVSVNIPRAVVTETNGVTITLTLHADEQNEVKKQTGLCISKETCVVVLAADGAEDMAANKNVLKNPNEVSAGWIKDSTKPKITQFSYSLGGFGGVITLVLDETVDASSLAEAKITLQNQQDATEEHELVSVIDKDNLVDGTTFELTLSADDVAAIKEKEFCTKREDCFARFAAGVFTDMSADDYTTDEITDANAEQAATVTPDTTDPVVLEFTELNYNTGSIHLKFKEPVDWDTLDASELTLYSFSRHDKAGFQLQLTDVPVDTNNDWGFGAGFEHPQVPHEITSDLVLTMTPEDLDALKLLDLCDSALGQDCSIGLGSGFIKDVSGNPLVASATQSSFESLADKVTLDTTGPLLMKAEVNIEASTLKLSFSEPVEADTISFSQLSFINNADPSSATESLAMDAADIGLDSKSNEFTITIPDSQLLKLKAVDGLCTQTTDCFVLLGEDFIKDVAASKNKNAAMTAGQRVTAFTKDSTPPTFTEFTSYNPNNGKFTLKFNEPIDKDSIVWVKITFQETASNPATDKLKVLTKTGSSSYVDSDTKLDVEFTMHSDDLEAIQLMTTNLLSKTSNSFVTFEADGIADMAGEKLAAVSTGKDAQSITARDAAQLNSFKLNMATNKLELTFDSAMKADSFKPDQITLMSAKGTGSSITTVALSADSSTDSGDGSVIEITIGEDDIDKITAARALATKGPDGNGDLGDTFLSLTATAFTNIFIDDISAVVPAKALSVAANGYTKDNISPKLLSFQFKLDPGSITMSFDEVVDLTTFDARELTIQSTTNEGEAIVLGGGVPEDITNGVGNTGRSLTFPLGSTDLNAIKANGKVGVTKDNTDIIMTANAISDMAGETVEKIDAPGKAASHVTGDLSGPEFESFTFSMNSGIILMTFSETMLPGSVAHEKITFQTAVTNPTDTFDLTAGPATAVSSTIIKLQMIAGDMNEVKAKRDLAKDEASTTLTLADGAFTDAAGNSLVGKTLAVATNGYEADTVAPTLAQMDLDMQAKTLTLSFSETVAGTGSPTTVDTTAITLVGLGVNGAAAPTYTLTAVSSLKEAIDADILVVNIHKTDLNKIKNTANLCTKKEDSFVAIDTTFVSDTGTKRLTSVSTGNAEDAASYQEDTGAPTMSSFSLDMNAKKLLINFNEPVDLDSFTVTNIQLQSAADVSSSGESHRFDKGSKAISVDGLTVTVTIDQDDLNEVNALPALALGTTSTYISFPASLVSDKSLPAVAMATSSNAQGIVASNYEDDADAPALVNFDLNMNKKELVLHFDETMDKDVVVSKFTLQSLSNADLNSGTQHRVLTAEGDCANNGGGKVTTLSAAVSLTIKICDSDILFMSLNGIGAATGATTTSSSFLTMAANAAQDTASQAAPALINGVNTLTVQAYTSDTTSPELIDTNGFDFSLNSGQIKLTFNEPVKVTEFDATAFTLQGVTAVNKVCACQRCLNNEWKEGDCTNDCTQDDTCVDTKCNVCTECAIGKFEFSACSATADSVCQICKACSTAEYLESYCYGKTEAVCKSCSDECAECTGEDKGGNDATCVQCNDGRVLYDGKCEATTCPDGTFVDSNAVCQPCHSTCATCTGAADTECKVGGCRASGFNQVAASGKCSSTCYAEGAVYTNTPTRGKYSHSIDGCVFCDATCLTCFGAGANECFSCHSGEALKNRNTCVASCGIGQVADNGICIKCSANCDVCDDASTCTACASNWVLESGKCFEMTPTYAEKLQLEAAVSQQISYSVGTQRDGEDDIQTRYADTSADFERCVTDSIPSYTLTCPDANDANSCTKIDPANDGTAITIQLTDTDLNEVKALTTLATSASNTYLAYTDEGIKDMALQKVAAKSPTPVCPNPCFGTCPCTMPNEAVSGMELDSTPIELAHFSLDLDGDGELKVTFSETFNLDDLNVRKLTLQDKADCSTTDKCADDTRVTLSGDARGANGPTQESNTIAVIKLIKDDLEKIKAIRSLATTASTTYAVIEASFATDMRPNQIAAITADDAKVATGFGPDGTSPNLDSYDLNVETGKLVLHFDETIDYSKVEPTAITLHSDASGANAYTLIGGSVSTDYSEDITITLDYTDLNKIKTTAIGVNQGSTYLSITNLAAKDTATAPDAQVSTANLVTAIDASSPKQVDTQGYLPDEQAPKLTAFKLDMHAGSITFTFDEAVNAGQFTPGEFALQKEAADDTVKVVLAVKVAPTTNDDEITVDLTDAVLNDIKLKGLCGSYDECFLTVTASGIEDMNSRSVEAKDSDGALDLKENMYTADAKDPELSKFTFDMDELEMKLTFTEPVAAMTFDATAITVQHAGTQANDKRLVFSASTGSAVKSSANNNGLVLTVGIAAADANKIKGIISLATSDQDTYLLLTSAAVKDLAKTPNSLKAITDGAAKKVEANGHTADTTSPSLDSFTLNMHTLTLMLSFDEIVNPATSKVTLGGLGLQNSFNVGDSDVISLSGGTITTVTPGTTITITLDDGDANKIKAVTSLCTGIGDTYLQVAAGAIVDMNDQDVNEKPQSQAKKVENDGYTADSKDPVLQSVEISMPVDDKPPMHIILEFDESVELTNENGVSTVDTTGITLQTVQDINNGGDTYTLTEQGTKAAVTGSSTKVDITISDADLLAIKAKGGLGRGTSNTFVVLDTKTIKDTSGNGVAEQPTNDAKVVGTHTADITPPVLNSFTIDFGLNQLALTFSEDVNAATFDAENVVVQRAAVAQSGDRGLTGAAAGYPKAGASNDIVLVKMLKADVDFIKADSALASDAGSTFINVPSDIVQDFALNEVGSATVKQIVDTLQNGFADDYIADAVGPVLEDYTFNMKTGTITMQFDEVVKRTSVTVSELKFQSAQTDNTIASEALEGAAQGSTDSPVVTILLTLASANKLRAVSTLAVSEATTFLTSGSNFATDVDDNAMDPILPGAAKQVEGGGFAADDEPPTASGFTMNLKLGRVTLTFTEPIDASTVTSDTAKQLTFIDDQANPTADNSHTLTGLDSNANAPSGLSQEVTLYFNSADLNSIKERALCDYVTEKDKCFVKFTNQFIKDSTGEAIAEVTAANAVKATGYVADDIPPTLTKFGKYDDNTGKITFEFDEVVDGGSLTPGGITLVADEDSSETPLSFKLTGGTIDAGTDNTKLVLQMSDGDRKSIKLKGMVAGSESASERLCSARQMCYVKLALDNSVPAFKDFGGNALAVTDTSANIRTKKHTKDTTEPELAEWSLNMQASTMSLTFTEAINAATFDRNAITVLKAQGSGESERVTLEACPAGDSCSTQTHGDVISVDISDDDVNAIKMAQFAISASTAYLSVTADLVKDLSATPNKLKAITQASAKVCESDGHSPDTDGPVFKGFTFFLDTGAIKFTFDEPVKPGALDVNGIVLQGAKGSQDKKITLTSGSAEETDAVSMYVTYIVTGDDLVNLISKDGLFSSEGNSFISIPAGAITDYVDRQSEVVAGSDALQINADGYTGDTTPGKLVRFDVDFAERQLQFTFDEIVKVSTFVAADVMIQSQQLRCPVVNGVKVCDSTAKYYELTDSTVVGTENNKVVKIQLSTTDYVALGETAGLLTQTSDSWIVTSAGAFDDTYGRDITASTDGANAVQLTATIEDNTKPTVINSVVNLQAKTMTLTVSEAVFDGTVDPRAITLQEAAGSCDTVACYTLKSTDYSLNDKVQDTITITLNADDLNAIKKDDKLVLTTATTSLAYTTALFEDFRNNEPLAVVAASAVAVNTLTADATDPSLDSFTINMDSGKIMLTFSEVIRASEVTMTAFTLQDAAQATTSHSLGGQGSVLQANDVTITITMDVSDLNAIKGKAMATETDGSNTYIVVTPAGAKDMLLPTGRDLTVIADGSGLKAASLTADETKPSLLSFVLNMNTGKLILSFSETVDGSQLDPEKLTFHEKADGSGKSFTLKKGTPTTATSTEITLTLDIDDLNDIKSDPLLLVSDATTYLAIAEDAVRDVSENNVNVIPGTATNNENLAHKGGSTFVPDSTDAELESFTLDMDGVGKLSLTFKESVNPADLEVNQITLQSTATGGSAVTLSDMTNPTTAVGVTVEFNLAEDDMIKLKLDSDLCTGTTNCFMSMTGSVIKDMVGNGAKVIDGDATVNALQVSTATNGFKADTTAPTLTSFTLNMNDAELVLLVSEPVADVVDLTELTLKSEDGTKDFTLTSVSSAALDANKMQVTVTIGAADLNKIKAEPTIAVSAASSVLTFASQLLTDRAAAGVGIAALVHSDTKIPIGQNSFQVDNEPPALAKHDYNEGTGVLKLHWTEAINLATFKKTFFTLIAQQGRRRRRALGSYTISDSGTVSIDPNDPTILVFTLSADDLFAIQKDSTLCTQKSNCLLAVQAGAVEDMQALEADEVEASAAEQPDVFTIDGSDPELKSFILNMNENKLYMTFTEIMKKSGFEPTTLKIMKAAAPGSAGVDITAGGTVSTPDGSDASDVMIFELNDANANAIKADTALATDLNGGTTGDTFLLYTSETAKDMKDNTLVALTPTGTGHAAASVVADSTPPLLSSGALNMNTGKLTIVFNEAIDINTMQQNSISFQGVANNPGINKVPLAATTDWTATDLVTVVITLHVDDLNALKKHESIATQADGSDTYISIAAATIKDMNQLPINAVDDSAAFDVTGFTADATKPTLESYEIDLSTGTIKLKFSETVDVDTLKPNQFTVQNCAD